MLQDDLFLNLYAGKAISEHPGDIGLPDGGHRDILAKDGDVDFIHNLRDLGRAAGCNLPFGPGCKSFFFE